ncbi:unnamed protein product, partial [Closterium sp. Naga37s-1]
MLRRAAAKGPPTGPLEGKASRFARSTRIASFVGVLVLLVVTTFCYTNHYFATVSDDSVHPDDLSDQESTSEASARGSDQTFPTVKPSATEKIAFLFLTRGPLPLVPLWDRFFQGHEGRYSVYVHASTPAFAFPPDFSPTFRDALIPGGKVAWGDFSMVAAERKLLAAAFFDPLNAFFALLSDSCIPLWPFTFIYSYVASANVSLLDAHHNKYRMGFRRYERHIFSPLIRKDDYVGGSQWFVLRRRHVQMITRDTAHYLTHQKSCQFRMKTGSRFCCADEHYIQVLLHLYDPSGISRYPTTFADWSLAEWHPKLFAAENVTSDLIASIKSSKQFLSYRNFWKDFRSNFSYIENPSLPQPEL